MSSPTLEHQNLVEHVIVSRNDSACDIETGSYFMIGSATPNSWYISKTYVNDTCRVSGVILVRDMHPVDWRVSVCNVGTVKKEKKTNVRNLPLRLQKRTGVISRPAPSRSVSVPPGCLFRNFVTS
jgi:hypothetical protein